MDNTIQIKYYGIKFLESSVEIKLKEKSKKDLVSNVVVFSVCLITLLFLFTIGLLGKQWFLLVLSSLAICLLLYASASGVILEQKRIKEYAFYLNKEGVTHKDVDKTYHLNWDEIVCFGLIKNNEISGKRYGLYTQSCIVFSKELYSEKQWYKKLDRIESNRYFHASNESTIVLALKQEDDGTIYNQIKVYIEKFSKSTTEISLEWNPFLSL